MYWSRSTFAAKNIQPLYPTNMHKQFALLFHMGGVTEKILSSVNITSSFHTAKQADHKVF